MRSTLRTLKDNKKELIAYANLLGLPGDTWADIAQYLVVTQNALQTTPDGTTFLSLPDICLQNQTPSCLNRSFFLSLFQPNTRLLCDRIMFAPEYNTLVENFSQNQRSPPVLTKGVSYPSSLQRTMSQEILSSDNVWLIDLFTWGTEYVKQLNCSNAFVVIDTTIYEGWNRFTDEELKRILLDTPQANPSAAIVDRFLETIRQTKYDFVIRNVRIRGAYLKAIAKVLKLPNVVRMEEIVQTSVFQENLNDALRVVSPLQAFSFEGDTNARDFTPFVYAEELALRKLVNADGCTGPLREDLPLNLRVLELYKKTGASPIPISWYTRPGNLPNVLFQDDKDNVLSVLSDPRYDNLRLFVTENMIKAGKISEVSTKPEDLTEALWQFMTEVQQEVNLAV